MRVARVQYDHEVNSFKFWWFRRSKSQTDGPCFDIINLKHLEKDYINDIFKLKSFLDIKLLLFDSGLSGKCSLYPDFPHKNLDEVDHVNYKLH